MKEIAIIGPTASGKSDAALQLALKHNAFILSIDSLSIYKEIDIASAKPSKSELASVRHFGIDLLYPNEHFSVATFIGLYREAKAAARRDGKNLIIVGGTGFYLKSLLTGISPMPEVSEETEKEARARLGDLEAAYRTLYEADPEYMRNIEPTDAYRIEKMLLLYLETGQTPTRWFDRHPPEPVVPSLPLFEIDVDRALLRERIARRTDKMIREGLIDEVAYLEWKYGRAPNAMKAIGIVEVLGFLDGTSDRAQMREQIITHTAQLAKRQQTFNRTQFDAKELLPMEKLISAASRALD
jgi:tRNA dimethylallyltransferase